MTVEGEVVLDGAPERPVLDGMYAHCRFCLQPVLDVEGAKHSQRLEFILGNDQRTFQLRCKIHDTNILTIEVRE